MYYSIRLHHLVVITACLAACLLCGYNFALGRTVFAAIFGLMSLGLAGVLIAMIYFLAYTVRTRSGRGVPLLGYIKDGETVLVRGVSPHMTNVGETILHLLIEKDIERIHCIADSRIFKSHPHGEAYFKRVGSSMEYVGSF